MRLQRRARRPCDREELALAYLAAKEHVIRSGFAEEVDWQSERDFEKLEETELLREAAWVVLSSGFRETIVRRLFPGISDAFLNWRDSSEIAERIDWCKESALEVFGHRQKIEAISTIVIHIATEGFPNVKDHIRRDGTAFIQQWPFMGPVTSIHLAKNLGASVVKPDRHLVRMAGAAGYLTPGEMCAAIAETVGDSLAVVDLVIWRYATIVPDYVEMFLSQRVAA